MLLSSWEKCPCPLILVLFNIHSFTTQQGSYYVPGFEDSAMTSMALLVTQRKYVYP